jgi:dienelactone hydrolase
MNGEIIKNKMISHKEFVLQGSKGKPILLDITFSNENTLEEKAVIIFCHGFKGFKDWGTFNLIAEWFAQNGFVFAKFNFSHNGTTLSHPTDFMAVEDFGNNNFLFELNETKSVINFMLDYQFAEFKIDKNNISIIGHSRGGGTAILAGAQHHAIKKIIGWAPVHEFLKYWDDEIVEKIKRDKVLWIENARTKQRLPMYYQYWENYGNNLDQLHIPTFVQQLTKHLLVLHGKSDEALDFKHSEEIKSWNFSKVSLELFENMNHTFGGKHPWLENYLPNDTMIILERSLVFLNS